jgi:hypothetical protein
MKVSELTTIIENIVSNEIRNTIMEENNGKKEVYHIKCEGIPLATFESEEEANDALPDYKAKHKGGELIIEKGVYESHDDMMDKLDEMNDQLEETENMENTEMQPEEGNAFSGALAAAKLKGDKEFKVGDKEYDVKEEKDRWCPRCKGNGCEECGGSGKIKNPSDEEECDECGSGYMEEEEEGGDDFENMLRGRRRRHYFGQKEYVDGDNSEEDVDDTEWVHDHPKDKTDHDPEEMEEEKKSCEKCGKELCECGGGMYESKKKTVRLTESELIKLISKMVNESIPGLQAAEKSRLESGKENKAYLSDVETKMKKLASFDGNDNPEFPKAIGKGEKVARKNTPEQEEEIAKNYAGLENLEYDIEPSEQFKKRLKMAIEGDTLMGNGKVTEPASIEPSNGADKGVEAKEKEGNHIQTPETAKKIEKQVKDREEDKKNRVLYSKEKVPVSESKVNFSNVLEEEIKKMKNISEYNKKTQ